MKKNNYAHVSYLTLTLPWGVYTPQDVAFFVYFFNWIKSDDALPVYP